MKHFVCIVYCILWLSKIGWTQKDTTRIVIKHVDYTEVGENNFYFMPTVQPELAEVFGAAEILNLKRSNQVTFDLVTSSDTNYLELPIDDKGSRLVIKNFRKYDELMINSLKIHKNCLGKEVTTVATYNRLKKDGSLDTTYKVERDRKTGVDAYEMDTLKSMNLMINGQEYSVKIWVKEDPLGMVTTGHGYIPKRFKKDIKNYRRRVSYFHFRKDTRQTIYWGELTLE